MRLHRAIDDACVAFEISSAHKTRPGFDKRNCKTSFCEVTLTKSLLASRPSSWRSTCTRTN